MDGKTLARIGAIIVVTIAITAAVIELRADQDRSAPVARSVSSTDHSSTSSLRRERLRCQTLGEAATRDRACLDAWAESRRRFLGVGPKGR